MNLLLPLLICFLFGTALKKLLGKLLGFRGISKIGFDVIMDLIRRFYFLQEGNKCGNCNRKGRSSMKYLQALQMHGKIIQDISGSSGTMVIHKSSITQSYPYMQDARKPSPCSLRYIINCFLWMKNSLWWTPSLQFLSQLFNNSINSEGRSIT